MKKTLIFSLLILLVWGCAPKKAGTAAGSKKSECEKFRHGTFLVEDRNIGHQSKIVRKGSVQVEKRLSDGQEMTLSVEWVDDCKYILAPENRSALPSSKLVGSRLVVEIDSIVGDRQYFTMYFESSPEEKMHNFMTKID